ncbi:hypothetical protein MASR1M32_17740 [Rhodobacter sp.]
MPAQKLYAGVKLREIRGRLSLTQKSFADKLGVSLPYLNQMENNHRPVSAAVVLALAQEFGLDVTELTVGESERLVSDMREALADPVFTAAAPPLADLRLAASNAPALARAFLDLHRAYRQTHERLASLDEALGREDAALRPSPWEEVRDFFHYCDNYLDAIDRAAEHFVMSANPRRDVAILAEELLRRQGITLHYSDNPTIRRFDPQTRRLEISARALGPTRRFQLLHQLALITQDELLEATLDLARFSTPEARDIAKIGLANYFAGAALLPYRAFQDATRETRYDLERLADIFGASVEQVAHRLSTLQRPGAKGIPFSSSASIRPAPSPSAILPPACNLPVSAAPARCGTSTPLLRHPGNSCASWRKPPMACAISALPATYRSPPAPISPRSAATRSALAARCSMRMNWCIPTVST